MMVLRSFPSRRPRFFVSYPPVSRPWRSSRRPWPCPAPAPPGLPPEAAGARCGADCILRLYLRPPWISPLPNDKKVTVRCQSRQFFINIACMELFFRSYHTFRKTSSRTDSGPLRGGQTPLRRNFPGKKSAGSFKIPVVTREISGIMRSAPGPARRGTGSLSVRHLPAIHTMWGCPRAFPKKRRR